ncbi:MAG: glycosyltransferase [Candidatus Nealsonbacteria bacterium]
MDNPIKLSIITLVYQNEKIEDYIREIQEKIIKRFRDLRVGGVEFIVAEDGSKDDTRAILQSIKEKYGLILNLGSQRRGYIGAAKEVYMQAKGEYIFFADSDRESDPGDFWKLWDKLQRENLDIVVGYRKSRRPYYRFFITKINGFLTGILFNVWLGDANAGFRIIKGNVARKIIPLTGNLLAAFNAEFFVIAKQLKYSYGEVPIKHFFQKSVVFPVKKMPLTLIRAFFELFRLKFKILKGAIKN